MFFLGKSRHLIGLELSETLLVKTVLKSILCYGVVQFFQKKILSVTMLVDSRKRPTHRVHLIFSWKLLKELRRKKILVVDANHFISDIHAFDLGTL